MFVGKARDLYGEVVRASKSEGGRSGVGEEEEEQKGEERSGTRRQGWRSDSDSVEGSGKRDRVTVRVCGGASRDALAGVGGANEGRWGWQEVL